MDPDLSPRMPKMTYGGAGGSYYEWCPDEFTMLRQCNIGAAKMLLEKDGLAIPRYSDSAVLAYVIQGNGVAGILLPDEKQERIVAINTGDSIPIPFGAITWWYNKYNTKLEVLFLGDTKTGHKPGLITDFFLAGSNGIFTGFSTEFVCRSWDVDESTAKLLVSSQTGNRIVKVDSEVKMPEPNKDHRSGMVFNREEGPSEDMIRTGHSHVTHLKTKSSFGVDFIRLHGNKSFFPLFSSDSVLQVIYIFRGSGRAQIVGPDRKRVLDTTIRAGNLFLVPRFHVVLNISDNEGLDWLSMVTTPNPKFYDLAGGKSLRTVLSHGVVQASFGIQRKVYNIDAGLKIIVWRYLSGRENHSAEIFVRESCLIGHRLDRSDYDILSWFVKKNCWETAGEYAVATELQAHLEEITMNAVQGPLAPEFNFPEIVKIMVYEYLISEERFQLAAAHFAVETGMNGEPEMGRDYLTVHWLYENGFPLTTACFAEWVAIHPYYVVPFQAPTLQYDSTKALKIMVFLFLQRLHPQCAYYFVSETNLYFDQQNLEYQKIILGWLWEFGGLNVASVYAEATQLQLMLQAIKKYTVEPQELPAPVLTDEGWQFFVDRYLTHEGFIKVAEAFRHQSRINIPSEGTTMANQLVTRWLFEHNCRMTAMCFAENFGESENPQFHLHSDLVVYLLTLLKQPYLSRGSIENKDPYAVKLWENHFTWW